MVTYAAHTYKPTYIHTYIPYFISDHELFASHLFATFPWLANTIHFALPKITTTTTTKSKKQKVLVVVAGWYKRNRTCTQRAITPQDNCEYFPFHYCPYRFVNAFRSIDMMFTFCGNCNGNSGFRGLSLPTTIIGFPQCHLAYGNMDENHFANHHLL